jgi:glyoxalase family protein
VEISPIRSLHHVTATVDDARQDLDFYRDLLGLRLVKRTVNFDNHHVYHFYYGDERGMPGTIWTTFPYKGHGVPVGRIGAGQIAVTSFSVPRDSLEFWRERLGARGVPVGEPAPTFGEERIAFSDPSGLAMELIAGARDARTPWTGGDVAPDDAIRGLHGVTLLLHRPDATVRLMTELLGFERVSETTGRIRLAVNGDEPGKLIDIVYGTGARAAMNGLGTVHHVAMAIDGAEAQLALRQRLIDYGLKVTEVLDRQYFQSIYFREPGGVLFEVATTQPGFTVDEPLATLGHELKLPPWEEPNRDAIERGLPPITAYV